MNGKRGSWKLQLEGIWDVKGKMGEKEKKDGKGDKKV